MNYSLRKRDLKFFESVIAFGDTLKALPEVTPEIRRNIELTQDLLRRLPVVVPGIRAGYAFSVSKLEPDYRGANRKWFVSVESFVDDPLISVGSICCIVPDRHEYLERGLEFDFTFTPGDSPCATSDSYTAWLREVADPNRWRNEEQDFEVEADFEETDQRRITRRPAPQRPDIIAAPGTFAINVAGEEVVRVTREKWRFVVEESTRHGRSVAEVALVDRHSLEVIILPVVRRTLAFVPRSDQEAEWKAAIEKQRKRLLRTVPAIVLRTQEACRRAAVRVGWLPCQVELYEHAEIVQDVVRYRAAAVALSNCIVLDNDPTRPVKLTRRRRVQTIERGLATMRAWRGVFAPKGQSYRSLDRTLVNVPPGIRADWLLLLCDVRLPRPLTTFDELGFVLSMLGAISHADERRGLDGLTVFGNAALHEAETPSTDRGLEEIPGYRDWRESRIRMVLRTTPAEIATGLARVFKATGRRGNRRRWEDMEFFGTFLIDYPGEHRGRLGGLVTKAIRWHRGISEPRDVVRSLRLSEGTPTAAPPLLPPAIDGVRFLATVADIVIEAETMQHCVAFRSPEAVEGSIYIFHIDHAGAQATVSVDRYGYVREASGPKNRRNRASLWGREMLQQWGDALQWRLLDLASGRASARGERVDTSP